MLKIIKDGQVATQEDLKKALGRFGFHVTQSSLSRDISELGLVKQHGHYVIAHSPVSQSQGPKPIITSIESAGTNMIVVKTLTGMASPVGLTIDNHRTPYIIGTVAGDDTVFVATLPGAGHELIKKNIRKLFKGA